MSLPYHSHSSRSAQSGSTDVHTKLNRAAHRGKIKACIHFIDHGADAFKRDKDGSSALDLACAAGYVEIVELFLSKCCNTAITSNCNINGKSRSSLGASGSSSFNLNDHRDKDGWSPLTWAACKGHLDVVDLLLRKGAIVNVKDTGNGWTPILFASSNGHDEVVNCLLLNGASVHSRAVLGWSPLLLAVKEGRLQVVDLLLVKGANMFDKNIDNRSVFSFALENIDTSPVILERIIRWPVIMAVICLNDLFIFNCLDTGNFISDLYEYLGDITS